MDSKKQQIKINFNEFMQLHVKGIRNTGIVLFVVGVLALILPMAAALAIELILGWLILLAGIAQVIHALRSKGSSRFWWEAGIGVLYCLVAFSLLLNPLQGLITLTLLLTILFIAEGIFKVILALQLRPASTWVWLLISGLLSCALGFIILTNLSGNARWVLGMMVGINFVFAGWALIKQASHFNKQ
ncbi:HdeD family acid-resistance protein [Paraglaciecola arctica]|uniref:HdeD protein n=1 Tax=Paraglaciecola arctica BSs20135 TaxID=493475 RepID=K6YCB2_9ALTE|nr:HdeD family acid-resistance protein [Paraglaciecola arctica]GAC21601.1 hypothetical protein GARC_4659 [Paraglaciecola arctica BSs20135]